MTKIEWTNKTWNPIVGCSLVSPGCTNCYAMRMARRLESMAAADERTPSAETPIAHYLGTTTVVNGKPIWTGKVARAPERVLLEPLRRKKPTMYFVNSMGDLFHEDVPDEWIDRVFAVMALCPQHTFQVLTKRADRMADYLTSMPWGFGRITGHAARLTCEDRAEEATAPHRLPLDNVWLGVSAERQREADERIPLLLETPAAIRFVSAEPLLGPIDFTTLAAADPLDNGTRWGVDALGGKRTRNAAHLDWIIVGGESGRGARAMHPDWARSIRDQCRASNVPFFFKQWGAHAWTPDDVSYTAAAGWGLQQGFPKGSKFECHSSGHTAFRVAKSKAGRLLDGREWNDMPEQEDA